MADGVNRDLARERLEMMIVIVSTESIRRVWIEFYRSMFIFFTCFLLWMNWETLIH